ncbi:MAG: hypothetical protein WBB31_10875 [Saprospiraceae bacterium]
MKSILLYFIGVLTFIIILCGFGIFLFAHSFDLDENKILKDSRAAFKREVFKKEIIAKSDEIHNMCIFLTRNADSLLFYNVKVNYVETKNNGVISRQPMKKDDFYRFSINKENFISYSGPKNLRDSIQYYLDKINPELILFFEVHSIKNNHNSFNNEQGNVDMYFNVEKKDPLNPNYYLSHYITYNQINVGQVLEIDNIRSNLKRDTVLSDRLIYSIEVSPYAGL